MTSKQNENQKVLIGSVRSELQYEYCAAKHFYFAPAIRLTEVEMPVAYVAMYHCVSAGVMGIDGYARVKRTRLVRRKDIPYPMTRNNFDEEYYRFDLDRTVKLKEPIVYRDETVYGPRETTLGRLLDSKETYELFLIETEEDRELDRNLRSAAESYANAPEAEPSFIINEYFTAKLADGHINLLNRRGTVVTKYSIDSYTEHPGEIFAEIRGELRRVALALER